MSGRWHAGYPVPPRLNARVTPFGHNVRHDRLKHPNVAASRSGENRFRADREQPRIHRRPACQATDARRSGEGRARDHLLHGGIHDPVRLDRLALARSAINPHSRGSLGISNLRLALRVYDRRKHANIAGHRRRSRLVVSGSRSALSRAGRMVARNRSQMPIALHKAGINRACSPLRTESRSGYEALKCVGPFSF